VERRVGWLAVQPVSLTVSESVSERIPFDKKVSLDDPPTDS
jgi:hypothetical protein